MELISISLVDKEGAAMDNTKQRLKILRSEYCLGIQIIRVYLT